MIKSFASPFDIDGIDDAIVESDSQNEVIQSYIDYKESYNGVIINRLIVRTNNFVFINTLVVRNPIIA